MHAFIQWVLSPAGVQPHLALRSAMARHRDALCSWCPLFVSPTYGPSAVFLGFCVGSTTRVPQGLGMFRSTRLVCYDVGVTGCFNGRRLGIEQWCSSHCFRHVAAQLGLPPVHCTTEGGMGLCAVPLDPWRGGIIHPCC